MTGPERAAIVRLWWRGWTVSRIAVHLAMPFQAVNKALFTRVMK